MKKLLILTACIFFYTCEDVIEVDLPSEEPRLIINAVLRVDKSQEFVGVKVKMTLTDDFFGEIPVTQVDAANIQYGDVDEESFLAPSSQSILIEKVPGSGIYEPLVTSTYDGRIRTADVTPEVTFFLAVTYNDRYYFSRTKYAPTVPIDNLEQGTETLFDEDETEVIITYTDAENRDDFYVFDFDNGNFMLSEDTYYKGQQFSFSYFYDDNVKPGDELEISILGADRQFYNYMNLLLQQTEENFGIFETPAATIRGNIFDFTDVDNTDQFDNTGATDTFPLGYFAVVQEYKQTIVIQDN